MIINPGHEASFPINIMSYLLSKFLSSPLLRVVPIIRKVKILKGGDEFLIIIIITINPPFLENSYI